MVEPTSEQIAKKTAFEIWDKCVMRDHLAVDKAEPIIQRAIDEAMAAQRLRTLRAVHKSVMMTQCVSGHMHVARAGAKLCAVLQDLIDDATEEEPSTTNIY